MAAYILCQNGLATQPYFIENIQTNIYSLEELCYYLYHNIYLADETLMNENLFSWVSNELRLPALAAKLRQNTGKFSGIDDFAYPIFKEINYLTYEELKGFGAMLAEYDSLSPRETKKRKADAFMKNGMVVKAISLYESILASAPALPEKEKERSREAALRSDVCYNLGCAYSYLFQMEKAADCFYQAAAISGRDEDMAAYLLAFRCTCQSKEFEEHMSQIPINARIRDLVKEAMEKYAALKKPGLPVNAEDEILDGLMRDYHRCMT